MGGVRRIGIGLGTATLALLAGCVGYGYPSSGGYGGSYPGTGGYPGDRYPGGGYASGSTLRCESDEGRTRHCRVDTRGGVSITRQLSRTACVQGRNWGWDNSGVWVSQGCRAEFVTGRGGGGYAPGYPTRPGAGYGQTVRCESDRGRQRRCNVQVGRGVDLVRQLSDTRCVRNQNWGWDRGGIWVDGGCRAEFRVR